MKKVLSSLVMFSMVASIIAGGFLPAKASAVAVDSNKVTICHATGSETHPYVSITPNKNGVLNGHDKHENDIIRPFDDYPGKNWDADHQAIYNNGCKLPDETPVDVCPNIAGVQLTVPDGMDIDDAGNCVVPPPACDVADNVQTIISDTTNTDEDGSSVLLSFIHPAWTAVISGANWIWATNPVVTVPNTDVTKTFTKTFTITGTPTSGTLDVAADNSYTVKVNGTVVPVTFDENNFQSDTQDTYDVGSLLQSGTNTLEITVTNWGVDQSTDPAANPAGLLYKLVAHNNDCLPTPTTGTLTVIKHVANGDATASQFLIHVKDAENTEVGSGPGDESGTQYVLPAGSYNISETGGPANYTGSTMFGEGNNCTSTGSVNVPAGGSATCIITNTFNADSDSVKSSNLSVIKSVNNKTPNLGDNVIYTITVSNAGPDDATNVVVNDLLPAGVTYVSDDAGGNYVPLTGVWTVGTLTNGSSATLQIIATVSANDESDQVIVNTATASSSNADSVSANNSDTATITTPTDVCLNIDGVQAEVPAGKHVNNDGNCVNNSGNGGGHAGGSVLGASTGGKVLGAETTCGIYLDKYLKKGRKNDPEAVKKVQKFLNDFFKAGIKEDGVLGDSTDKNIKAFQQAHKDKVLDPWHLKGPTGIVYLTTTTEINNIECPTLGLPIPTDLTPFDSNPKAPK